MITTINRRKFISQLSVNLLGIGIAGGSVFDQTVPAEKKVSLKSNGKMIWANLLHLGRNMWIDRETGGNLSPDIYARPYLRFDTSLWNDLLKKMVDVGMNMVIIDLGEGVNYESHPELAVKNSWPVVRLRQELAKLRKMGLEPIPKLNFSATHDHWLGPYSRMLSTDTYYAVCRDLITEVIELFDKPRFFHLGMDEETLHHQSLYDTVVIRQYDLWWKDFYFLVEQVEKGGVRSWIWSDYLWRHPDLFFKKMPKSVLQSNWYYGEQFNNDIDQVKAYLDLEEHGFDQIPTGSNWSNDVNFGRTVDFCTKYITPERLFGFMTAPWKPTLEKYREHHMNAIEQVGKACASVPEKFLESLEI